MLRLSRFMVPQTFLSYTFLSFSRGPGSAVFSMSVVLCGDKCCVMLCPAVPFRLQVANVRRTGLSQIGVPLPEVTASTLLVLAAQQQQQVQQNQQPQPQQQYQQHPSPPARQQQQLSQGSPTLASQISHAAAYDDDSPDRSFTELQLSSRVDHLAAHVAMVAMLAADTLTLTQRAQWMVASSPWYVCAYACMLGHPMPS